MASVDWPEPAAALELHARMLTGDRTATAAFAEAVLEPLIADLRRRHPRWDDHALQTAAVDAVKSLLQNARLFDPSRGTGVAGYLRMAADGDLRNAWAKEAKHRDGRHSLDFVESVPDGRKENTEDDDGPAWDAPDVQAALAELDPTDRRVVELIRGGERSTAAFAAVYGLADLPPDQQQAGVKRHKDRIKQHLRRSLGAS